MENFKYLDTIKLQHINDILHVHIDKRFIKDKNEQKIQNNEAFHLVNQYKKDNNISNVVYHTKI